MRVFSGSPESGMVGENADWNRFERAELKSCAGGKNGLAALGVKEAKGKGMGR